MPSPFPGMDPYLERPGTWLDVHSTVITFLRNDLNASLGGRYFAVAGERVVVEGGDPPSRSIYPDVRVVRSPGSTSSRSTGSLVAADPPRPIHIKAARSEFREAYLEIRDRTEKVVTVIEFLSPSNKTKGSPGRRKYRRKQNEILDSDTSLVEIDLLRAGAWTVAAPEAVVRQEAGPFDYVVSISCPGDRTEFDVYAIPLRSRLPEIAIPLSPGDEHATADLRSLLDRCYDSGLYGQRIDYHADPVPPLTGKNAAWADGLLRGAGIR